ncbi:hypothetical protein C4588_03325 [Candidatus Parcubacteria bacterium]|nr:MAG: hypothetical protein C4588_03325 [Candidatus Parcubacteria bacterium]
MKKMKRYTIRKESLEDQIAARRVNPSLELCFRDARGLHTHKISAGFSDEINVYKEDGLTFVLCHHPRLGYAGLEVFDGKESVCDVFVHGEELDYVMGPRELSPAQMIRRLKDLLPI